MKEQEDGFGLGVASEYVGESTGGNKFMKGAEFDAGIDVEVVSMKKFTPKDQQYGVKNVYGAGGVVTKKNYFVDKGLLEEGESWKYTFKVDGEEREFDNNSCSFYFAFTKKNPKAGDKLNIKRTKNSPTDVVWALMDK